jgi:hypothetical protein
MRKSTEPAGRIHRVGFPASLQGLRGRGEPGLASEYKISKIPCREDSLQACRSEA